MQNGNLEESQQINTPEEPKKKSGENSLSRNKNLSNYLAAEIDSQHKKFVEMLISIDNSFFEGSEDEKKSEEKSQEKLLCKNKSISFLPALNCKKKKNSGNFIRNFS